MITKKMLVISCVFVVLPLCGMRRFGGTIIRGIYVRSFRVNRLNRSRIQLHNNRSKQRFFCTENKVTEPTTRIENSLENIAQELKTRNKLVNSIDRTLTMILLVLSAQLGASIVK